jgi:hypothetical protein
MYKSLGTLTSAMQKLFLPQELRDMITWSQEITDQIYVLDYSMRNPGHEYIVINANLAVQGELSLTPPGLDVITIVAGGAASATEFENDLSEKLELADDPATEEEPVLEQEQSTSFNLDGYTLFFLSLELHANEVLVTVHKWKTAIRFSPDLLKPISLDEDEEPAEFAELYMIGSMSINHLLEITSEGFDSFNLTPCMIGNTGVVIQASGVQFDIGAGHAGVTLQQAKVILPPSLIGNVLDVLPQIEFTDAEINNSGFSGTVSLDWPLGKNNAGKFIYRVTVFNSDGSTSEEDHDANLFGINGGIEHFSISIKDNEITGSDIRGQLIVPYFNKPVGIKINIENNGDFSVTLYSLGGNGITLTQEQLLSLTVEKLTVQKQDGVGSIVISGGMEPLLWQSDGLQWPRLDVKDLYIDSKGKMRFKEAWVDLKDLCTLDLFGFHFELHKIGFGTEVDADKLWLDLSGSLKLIEQLPIGLGIEGFRVAWPRTLLEDLNINDPANIDVQGIMQIATRIEVRFDGVHLLNAVPSVYEFEGLVRFLKEARMVGFAGDMVLRLPTLGLTIEAGFLVGMNMEDPPYPFLYLYFGVELPAGIPLGQSGLALKGALGLIGINVAPDKTPEQNWYYDWYKRGPIVGAHPTNKWKAQNHALSFGAGLTITTADGFVKGVRGLIVLSIPGPVLMIEGRGLVFNGTIPQEPPFRALAVFDGNEQTVQFNLEAGLELAEGIIDVDAMLEAFFDFKNLTNWHLYLGQNEPVDRRIKANILKLDDSYLFKGDAYLMLDMTGAGSLRTRLGASIGFRPPEFKLDPVTVSCKAEIGGHGELSVNPEQFSAGLDLDASVEIKGFNLSMELSASAEVNTRGIRPLWVDGEVELSVDLPIGDPLEVEIPFEWEYPAAPEVTSPLSKIAIGSEFDKSGGGELVLNNSSSLSWSSRRQKAIQSLVSPVDSRPSFVFNQDMNVADGMLIGVAGNGDTHMYTSGDDFRFEPQIDRITIHRHRKRDPWTDSSSDWELVADTDSVSKPFWGVWMADFSTNHSSAPSSRNLKMWTANPLAVFGQVLRSTDTTWLRVGRQSSSLGDEFLKGYPNFFHCKNYKAKEECFKTTYDLAWKPDKKKKLKQGYAIGTISIYGDGVYIEEGNTLGSETVVRLRFSQRMYSVSIEGSQVQGTYTTRQDIDSPSEWKQVVLKAKESKTEPVFKCAKLVENSVQQHGTRITIRSEKGFDCIEIKPVRELKVNTICTVSLHEKKRESKAKTECGVNDEIIERITETVEVLEAGAYYRIRIDMSVQGTVTNDVTAFLIGEDEVEDLETTSFSVESFFQTEAPPSNLQPYLKWMSPTSGQNDFFHENDFNFCFIRSYMRTIYDTNAAHNLELLLKDADGNCIGGFFPNWTKSPNATLLPEEKQWKEYVDPDNERAVPFDDQFQARRLFLFMEDFTRLDSNIWTVGNNATSALSRWRIGYRSLQQLASISGGSSHLEAKAGTYIVAGDAGWTRYRFSCTIQSSSTTAIKAAGVLFCYVDERHYYLAVLSERVDVLQLIKFNGQETGELLLSVPFTGDLKNPTNLEVEISTDSSANKIIRVYVRNEVRIEYKDRTNSLTQGKVGLYSYESAGISYSRIRVAPVDGMLNASAKYEVLLAGGEGGSLLVEDNFNDAAFSDKWLPSSADGWTIIPATGGDRFGTLRSRTNVDQQIVRAEKPVDFDMSVWIKRDGRAGILFREGNFKDHAGVARRHDYRLKLESNVYRLHHCIDKVSSLAIEEKATRFAGFDWIRLRIRLVGSRCSVWEFDELLFTVDLRSKYPADNSNGLKLISNGAFGLVATATGDKFRRLTIRDVALLRSNIMTSRYESIQHLVNSCPPESILPMTVAVIPARQALLTAGDLFSRHSYDCWKASVDFRHTIINREQFEATQLLLRSTKSELDRLFIDFCKQLSEYFFVPLERDLEIKLVRQANTIKGIWFKSHESLRIFRPLDAINGFTGNNSIVVYRQGAASQTLVQMDMVANSDSNQVLLLCKGNGSMAAGKYIISCRYFRDQLDGTSSSVDHFYDRPVELYESLSGTLNIGELIEIPFTVQ